jgi:hypothetical protein
VPSGTAFSVDARDVPGDPVAAAVSGNPVKAWDEVVHIPTYPAPAPDKNPMFLEKRVYQGSSGKVYPNAFTDRISDDKRHQPYRAVSSKTTLCRS